MVFVLTIDEYHQNDYRQDGDAEKDEIIVTENFPDWKAWAIFAAAFVLGFTKKAGPIAIILGAGVLGLLIY